MAVFLSIFQDESMWGTGMSSIVIIIIMCNGFLISIVIMISSIIELVQWWKKKINKNKVKIVNDLKSEQASRNEDVSANDNSKK